MPSGGWVGTAEDVARLGPALLDREFLSAESLALLRTSQRTHLADIARLFER